MEIQTLHQNNHISIINIIKEFEWIPSIPWLETILLDICNKNRNIITISGLYRLIECLIILVILIIFTLIFII